MSSLDRRSLLKSAAALALTPLGCAFAGSEPKSGADVDPKAPAAKTPDPKAPATKPKVDPYADAVLVNGEPPAPAADSFTVVVLPDTQNYSEKHPAIYKAQTDWIAANRKARNIAMVLHLGDITNKNTAPEWAAASAAMKVLDDAGMPYAYCPGNHDYSTGGGCRDRTTGLNELFTPARCKAQSTFGGFYDKETDRTENSYHTFRAGGRDFVVLALEFGPRADVIRWANQVAAAHPGHEAILITHVFVYHDDTRYDWKTHGAKQNWNPHSYPLAKASMDDVADGEELWNGLVAKHENFILTLNGHVLGDGLGRVKTATPAGREIEQLLVNFQMRPNGGDGWMRLLEFKTDRTIEAWDWSPTRKQRNEGRQNRITLAAAAPKV